MVPKQEDKRDFQKFIRRRILGSDGEGLQLPFLSFKFLTILAQIKTT
jgi:hypothetical protein